MRHCFSEGDLMHHSLDDAFYSGLFPATDNLKPNQMVGSRAFNFRPLLQYSVYREAANNHQPNSMTRHPTTDLGPITPLLRLQRGCQ